MIFVIRHVILPKEIAKVVPRDKLMPESHWRKIGVQQSQGWVHYMVHKPGNKLCQYKIVHFGVVFIMIPSGVLSFSMFLIQLQRACCIHFLLEQCNEVFFQSVKRSEIYWWSIIRVMKMQLWFVIALTKSVICYSTKKLLSLYPFKVLFSQRLTIYFCRGKPWELFGVRF